MLGDRNEDDLGVGQCGVDPFVNAVNWFGSSAVALVSHRCRRHRARRSAAMRNHDPSAYFTESEIGSRRIPVDHLPPSSRKRLRRFSARWTRRRTIASVKRQWAVRSSNPAIVGSGDRPSPERSTSCAFRRCEPSKEGADRGEHGHTPNRRLVLKVIQRVLLLESCGGEPTRRSLASDIG